jgi:hypothetical protein
MSYLPNFIFLILIIVGGGIFLRNILRIKRNINLGKAVDRSDKTALRWKQMLRIALGQSKMGSKPIAAILHLIVYVGFIIINIELLEIILDGLLGTHRLFAPYLGNLYHILIGTFEILALLESGNERLAQTRCRPYFVFRSGSDDVIFIDECYRLFVTATRITLYPSR